MFSYFLYFLARSNVRVGDGGALGMHRLARKHEKQASIEMNDTDLRWMAVRMRASLGDGMESTKLCQAG